MTAAKEREQKRNENTQRKITLQFETSMREQEAAPRARCHYFPTVPRPNKTRIGGPGPGQGTGVVLTSADKYPRIQRPCKNANAHYR